MFWRYGLLENPAILLAEYILAHISGTKTFPTIQNTLVMAHFSNFAGKKDIYGKSGSVMQNSYGLLVPCQNLEKPNDIIPRKSPDRWKNRYKNKQTLFYRTLPATAEGFKNEISVTFLENISLVGAYSLIETFQAFAAVLSFPLRFNI